MLNQDQIREAVEKARAKIALEKAAKEAKLARAADFQARIVKPTEIRAVVPENIPRAPEQFLQPGTVDWNQEQQMAIDYGVGGQSFVLIGAAGTGKTTTLKGIMKAVVNRIPPLEESTNYLVKGAPGIALVSYTRRAVRNIAKQMPDDLRGHCLTIHKLIEFAPEYYTETNEMGEEINKMRFAPSRHRYNPLPRNLKLIIVDEASMPSIDLFNQLLDALPDPTGVQFIFLGDLNQLPPVYGQAILGLKLLELPIIELTRVYRQALESPIISLALAVKNNDFRIFDQECKDGTFKVTGKFETAKKLTEKLIVERVGRGKVTLHPWKQQLEQETALMMMLKQIKVWINNKEYLPDEDVILCPWAKPGVFGAHELNLGIADKLGKDRGAVVHEVIAGFQKHYLAVGDKLLVDKQDAIIEEIQVNGKYIGAGFSPASKELNRWGVYENNAKAVVQDKPSLTNDDIDELLNTMVSDAVEDRVHEASHAIRVKVLDTDEVVTISKAGELNACAFGYAMTVHKAQGSEWRRVFFVTHYCHAAMCFRELVYTGITRAAEELYIIQSPQMLGTAANKPRIKGDTLAAKLEYFNTKLQEKIA